MAAVDTERIAEMRLQNYSYSFIGRALDMSPNTVKSICRRQGFAAKGPRKSKVEKQQAPLCKNCHRLLTGGRSDRAFCSEKCRTEWRRKHLKIIEE